MSKQVQIYQATPPLHVLQLEDPGQALSCERRFLPPRAAGIPHICGRAPGSGAPPVPGPGSCCWAWAGRMVYISVNISRCCRRPAATAGKCYAVLWKKFVQFAAGFRKYYFKHIKMFDNLEKRAFYGYLMGNNINIIVCNGTDLCSTRLMTCQLITAMLILPNISEQSDCFQSTKARFV